ncbi:pisatin demethylase [Colletotrichum spaethianum]|uniref:Pisatin demethylase n=1 Tax=Colletotrichum spaethianum TaxID=700344 RepID=A0AA37P606_9PEZI|nr:pisatin demethylase [Colletotrichum spaethianum]GKT45156.1 pisatin demethylase [Colletotrichum spaethianum]
MPNLQAVIKEALRVHPAVGLLTERVVPEGGASIAGRFFPGGSVVGINAWVQHRNQTLFEDDADYFRPDRWLINDDNKISVMNRNWIPVKIHPFWKYRSSSLEFFATLTSGFAALLEHQADREKLVPFGF